MKLRSSIRHYMIMTEILSQYTVDSVQVNQINFALFKEMRKEFLKVSARYVLSQNLDKKVSKEIPDSQAILFFMNFNGINAGGYANVVLKEICSQIESELFVSGKYTLTLNFR
jgi:hypothetical protein